VVTMDGYGWIFFKPFECALSYHQWQRLWKVCSILKSPSSKSCCDSCKWFEQADFRWVKKINGFVQVFHMGGGGFL
jgi:hypothetical protein